MWRTAGSLKRFNGVEDEKNFLTGSDALSMRTSPLSPHKDEGIISVYCREG
jgi:hypothetical protein